MSEFNRLGQDLKESLRLQKEAIAVSFLDEVPKDIPRYGGPEVPSGCSFWVKCQDSTFYTVAEDHLNCPIGTITQGFSIPEERMGEAQTLFELMVDNRYVSTQELENVPKIKSTPKAVVYSTLSRVTSGPDVVLLACNAYQAMLLSEAVIASGFGGFSGPMGRPTCAALPVTLESENPTLSLGCIGNRVYTQLGEDQMVITIPGKKLDAIVTNLSDMVKTNALLEGAHTEKKQITGRS